MSAKLPDGFRVEVNSKDGCPSCEMAKAALAASGIAYTEIVRNDREERRAFYRDVCGLDPDRGTVPQIFLVDEASGLRESIGGYEALLASGLI